MHSKNEFRNCVALALSSMLKYTLETEPFEEVYAVDNTYALYAGFELAGNRKVVAKFSTQIARMEAEYQLFCNLSKDERCRRFVSVPIEFIEFSHIDLSAHVLFDAGHHDILSTFYDYFRNHPIDYIRYCISVCRCVEFLHSKDIVHGEIRFESFRPIKDYSNVIMLNIGSGASSFHNYLQAYNWQRFYEDSQSMSRITYISPEQTGRTSYPVDHRTDIYSLGIFFYYCLAEGYPHLDSFIQTIRSILTEHLPSIADACPQIPKTIFKIIEKMTKKNPNDRYTSCSSILADLEICYDNLVNGITSGEGIFDNTGFTSLFMLPSSTYGREREIEKVKSLLRHTESTSLPLDSSFHDSPFLKGNEHSDHIVVILITGPEGVGKATFIQDVCDRKEGYMAITKCEPSESFSNSALIRGIAQLILQVLAESQHLVHEFFQKLKHALEGDLYLLNSVFDIVPEVKPFLDKSPYVGNIISFLSTSSNESVKSSSSLGRSANSQETQYNSDQRNQFGHQISLSSSLITLLTMISSLKRSTIVIKNVHYADELSINILECLIRCNVPISIILTCDDSYANLLKNFLSFSRFVQEVQLKPLAFDAVNAYVQTTLHRVGEDLYPFTSYVYHVCKGNPLLMRDLLSELYNKKVIYFDWETRQWSIDYDEVNLFSPESYNINVDSYSITKLSSLPEPCRCFLAWGSMMGSSFSFETVQKLCQEVEGFDLDNESLDLLLRKGIIYATSTNSYSISRGSYKKTIKNYYSQEKLQRMHARLFELCINNRDQYSLFDIASHVDAAFEYIKNEDNSTLNFTYLYLAAEEALKIGANKKALNLYNRCIEILPYKYYNRENDDERKQMIQIYVGCAEANLVNGNAEAAMKMTKLAENESANLTEAFKSLFLRCRVLFESLRSEELLSLVLNYLTQLGFSIEKHNFEDSKEILKSLIPKVLKYADEEKSIEIDNATILDDRSTEIFYFLFQGFSAASRYYQCSPIVVDFSIAFANAFLEYGFTDFSGYTLLFFSVTAMTIVGPSAPLFKMCNLARKLNQEIQNYTIQTYTEFFYLLSIGYVTETLQKRMVSIRTLQKHCQPSSRFLGNSLSVFSLWDSFLLSSNYGDFLIEFDEVYGEALKQRLWVADSVYFPNLRTLIQCLLGETELGPCESLYNKERQLPASPEKNLSETFGRWYFSWHLLNLVLTEDWEDVICYGLNSCFGYFLLCLAITNKGLTNGMLSDNEKTFFLEKLKFFEYISTSSESCSPITLYFYFLQASKVTLDGDLTKASVLYEKVIALATKLNLYLVEAFALEAVGKLFCKINLTTSGIHYIEQSVKVYKSLGLKRKYTTLQNQIIDKMPPNLLKLTVDEIVQTDTAYEQRPYSTDTSDKAEDDDLVESNYRISFPNEDYEDQACTMANVGTVSLEELLISLDIIDLTSVMKSCQTIASETELDGLLSTMTLRMLEDSSADAASIVIREDNHFTVAAYRTENVNEVFTPPIPVSERQPFVPSKVINYVVHTQKVLFSHNIHKDFDLHCEEWNELNNKGKNVIVIPLIQKKVVFAVLYLQGPPFSFHCRHVSVLSILGSQVSFAIVNISLFHKVKEATNANNEIIESQREALSLVRKSEAKYRSFVDTMPCLLSKLKYDSGLKIELFGSFWKEYCGDTDLRKPNICKEFIHPQDYDILEQHIISQSNVNAPFEKEVRIRRNDGVYRCNLTRCTPILNESEPTYICATIDIGDQKEARAAALEATRLRSNFLANISHELRTPFSGFYGMLSLLDEANLDYEQRDIVNAARLSCEMLLQVINDLLNFSKLEAGKVTLESDLEFSLERVIVDCIASVYSVAVSKNVTLSYQLSNDIPYFIAGDASKIGQMLKSILDNSVKMVESGFISVKAYIFENGENDDLRLTFMVEDSRPEPNAVFQANLINSLNKYCNDNLPMDLSGSALGMSTCLQLCKIMGGSVFVTVSKTPPTFRICYDLMVHKLREERYREVTANLVEAKVKFNEYIKNKLVIRATNVPLDSDNILTFLTEAEKLVHVTSCPEAFASFLDQGRQYLNIARCLLILDVDSLEHLEKVNTELKTFPDLNVIFVSCIPQLNKTYDQKSISPEFSEYIGKRRTMIAKPYTKEQFVDATLRIVHPEQDKLRETSSYLPLGHEQTESNRQSWQFEGIRILVAEDNSVVRLTLVKQLEHLGLKIESAKDGKEAIELIASHPCGYYNLAFIDYHMPYYDGIEVSKKMRELEQRENIRSSVPIILLTADIQPSIEEGNEDMGITRYITKPIRKEKMLEILYAYLT
ncbi:HisK/Mak3 protein kinase Mak3 [Schizosaccharomyces cryophilus OY26]|uniref:histidine kinase n=1 Tax=Schizosaccharomyces cryophilus (strain OY26 / ATCC MYA-4695 / CBS 11777 / NBRC 106824 / NRRL Y48691) TaxID=653667 RepID=S9VYA8_SCHCR|nr:HisK/Mak3 protein kinase Mak3 [Schizosaccharomyces cryophilus OY26]EPY51239.1 HisK/Mak3 protein kinase Mak3 [Schizosaccharomyces cryophilus OY26]